MHHWKTKRVRRAVQATAAVVAVGAALATAPSGAAHAEALPTRSTGPTLVSVPDPYAPADCGMYPIASAVRPRNAPHEPDVAVNPADPRNVVTAYIVDGYVTNLVRTSRDGGASWATVQTGLCGSPLTANADPALAFNADGSVLYLAGLAMAVGPSPNTVVVNRSLDGGRTWSPSVVVSPPDGLHTDMNFVTTDPADPRSAYITFERHDTAGETSTLYVAGTHDGGMTWSAPRVVFRAPSGFESSAAHVSVVRDQLVIVFQQIIAIDAEGEDNVVLSTRSADDGVTWTAPTRITNRTAGYASHGPDCSLWTMPQSAVSRDGTIYVSTVLGTNPDSLASSIVLFRSTDAGTTWTRIGGLDSPSLLGMTTLAVAPNGAIGMTFYELDNLTCGTPLSAHVDYATSHDGRTWTRGHLSGSVNPNAVCTAGFTPFGGCVISDYSGLAVRGQGSFVADFELTAPAAVNGPSDIFLASFPR